MCTWANKRQSVIIIIIVVVVVRKLWKGLRETQRDGEAPRLAGCWLRSVALGLGREGSFQNLNQTQVRKRMPDSSCGLQQLGGSREINAPTSLSSLLPPFYQCRPLTSQQQWSLWMQAILRQPPEPTAGWKRVENGHGGQTEMPCIRAEHLITLNVPLAYRGICFVCNSGDKDILTVGISLTYQKQNTSCVS